MEASDSRFDIVEYFKRRQLNQPLFISEEVDVLPYKTSMIACRTLKSTGSQQPMFSPSPSREGNAIVRRYGGDTTTTRQSPSSGDKHCKMLAHCVKSQSWLLLDVRPEPAYRIYMDDITSRHRQLQFIRNVATASEQLSLSPRFRSLTLYVHMIEELYIQMRRDNHEWSTEEMVTRMAAALDALGYSSYEHWDEIIQYTTPQPVTPSNVIICEESDDDNESVPDLTTSTFSETWEYRHRSPTEDHSRPTSPESYDDCDISDEDTAESASDVDAIDQMLADLADIRIHQPKHIPTVSRSACGPVKTTSHRYRRLPKTPRHCTDDIDATTRDRARRLRPRGLSARRHVVLPERRTLRSWMRRTAKTYEFFRA